MNTKHTFSAFTLAAVIYCSHALGNLEIEEKTPLDGWEMFEYQVDEAQIARTPAWNPLSGDSVPIPAEKAVRLARKHLAKNVKDLKDYIVNAVELKSADVEVKKGAAFERRWYWCVSFENYAVGAIGGVPLTTKIIVLMNGWSPPLKKSEIDDSQDVNDRSKDGQPDSGANRRSTTVPKSDSKPAGGTP